MKHADACRISVRVDAVSAESADALLRVRISDDGRGGADRGAGSGIAGLGDRVTAVGGRLRLQSAPGRGTTVEAELPCVS